MPQNNNNIKKRIIKAVKERNKHESGKLSFTQMYDQLDTILKIKNQEEREHAFVAFHCLWTQALAENLLAQRAVLQSNIFMSEKNFNHPAMDYSLSLASGYVKALTKDILRLIDPEYAEKHIYNHSQLEEIHRFEMDMLNNYTYYTEIPKILKAWSKNLDCFYQEISTIDDFFRFNKADEEPHVYTGDPKNQWDVGAAEFYYKSTLIREKLAKHNPLWRFFNFKKVAAYNQYLSKVDEALNKIGFNPEIHGEDALNILKTTIIQPHEIDLEHVTDELMDAKREYTLATLEKISVAADKANKAFSPEGEASFEKKIEPFAKKYNFVLEETEIKASRPEIDKIAKQYDEERKTEEMPELMRSTFFYTFALMVSNAMKRGEEINFNEIFNDARKIAVIKVQHYTPFFEIDESANMESPSYMKRITEQWIEKRIDFYVKQSNGHWETVEEESNKKGVPVPEYVQKAREALTPERIEELKKQAVEAVKQWRANIGALAKEDLELAQSLASNEAQVEAEDTSKVSISVNIDEKIIEEVSEINEESFTIDEIKPNLQ